MYFFCTSLFVQSFCLAEVSSKVMQKEQQYSYFRYILFFRFVFLNDQPNAFFQAFALIPVGDFQTQVLKKVT